MVHTTTGVILIVRNFEECVAFYRELFGLEVLHEKSDGEFRLTCLEFGNSYLMIESAPPSDQSANEENSAQHYAKLRFNVPDIEAALETVRAYGIDAQIERHDWGSSINIADPDGNPVGIRDQQGFDRDNEQFSKSNK